MTNIGRKSIETHDQNLVPFWAPELSDVNICERFTTHLATPSETDDKHCGNMRGNFTTFDSTLGTETMWEIQAHPLRSQSVPNVLGRSMPLQNCETLSRDFCVGAFCR